MSQNSAMVDLLQQEAHIRIDLTRYANNVRHLKELAGDERELMVVVKGDAYGHGAVQCGRVALENGATWLAVARIWEAIRLREAGIDAPILLLGGPNLSTLDLAIEHNVTVSIGGRAALESAILAGEKAGKPVNAHLKLDTGMHRYGFQPDEVLDAARRLHESPWIHLEGVYAHFSSADEVDDVPTGRQLQLAHDMLDEIEAAGITFRYIHLPNSAAILTGRMGRSTIARAGIASYGLAPSADVPLPDEIKPVMSIHGPITRVATLQPGEGISYGLTYMCEAEEHAGTVPVGYADGLPRALSNLGWFVVDGVRCPVRGRVCMDQTIIGLPHDVPEYADVVIVGDRDSGAMTLDDVAGLSDTINYEATSRFAMRLPRIYLEHGQPVAFDMPGRADITE